MEHFIQLRVTKEDKDYLQKEADKMRLPLASYCRYMLMKKNSNELH